MKAGSLAQAAKLHDCLATIDRFAATLTALGQDEQFQQASGLEKELDLSALQNLSTEMRDKVQGMLGGISSSKTKALRSVISSTILLSQCSHITKLHTV